MERTKEAAWCCGGGGAAPQAYPDFADFTASKRLDEGQVHRGPRPSHSVLELQPHPGSAAAGDRTTMKAIDVLELVEQAL
jgi:hypothetical protein